MTPRPTESSHPLTLATLALLAIVGCSQPGQDQASYGIESVTSAMTIGNVQINCGGPGLGTFIADTDFTNGAEKTRNNTIDLTGVVNPAPMAVYQSQRYASPFGYTIPGFTPGSNQLIRLHFAETNPANDKPKARLFSVAINGTTVISNLDLYATVGLNHAYVEQFTLPANSSGQYVLSFSASADSATISGIEVQSAAVGAGWIPVGPNGVSQTGSSNVFSGVTTDVEADPGPVYRISTSAAGILQLNGSQWVGLMNTIVPPELDLGSPPTAAEGLDVNSFATRPGNNNYIIAGTAGENQHMAAHGGFSGPSGIWIGQSSDGTSWTWTRPSSGAASIVGDVFKVRWSTANIVHAATSTGYFVSSDGGNTWVNQNGQNGTDLGCAGAYSDLVVAPNNSGFVFLARDVDGAVLANLGSGSTPSCSIAFSANANKLQSPNRSAIAADSNGCMYYMPSDSAATNVQGVFQVCGCELIGCTPPVQIMSASTAKLLNTNPVAGQLQWAISLTVNPANPKVLVAGGVKALSTQVGGGTLVPTWKTPTGLHDDHHAFGWDIGVGGSQALAVNDGGFFTSSDNGKTWLSNNPSPMTSLTDFDIQFIGGSPAANNLYGTAWDTGSFVSNNGGTSWTSGVVNGDLDGDHLFVIAHPSTPGHAWMANTGALVPNVPNQPCHYQTTDGGATWNGIDPSGVCDGWMRIEHDRNGANLWIYTGNGKTVVRSRDPVSKTSWTQYGNAFSSNVVDIAVGTYLSSLGGSIVYASGTQGPTTGWFASAAGKGWYPMVFPTGSGPCTTGGATMCTFKAPNLIRTHSGDAHQAYAFYQYGPPEVFWTSTDGATWESITGDLQQQDPHGDLGILDLVVDPQTNGATTTLYIATTAGVYKSTNNGVHWTRWIENLPASGSQSIWRLRTYRSSPTGHMSVYAGIWGGGIWHRDGTDSD
jgi:hypothetical protein